MQNQLRQGIVSTASALGIDPLDLATAISYETAGTFDPTKRGPTTKWGQHRGLIQFGEPQAQQYGVDWGDPLGSQLGPEGAVANYLRDTGVQPGMGLLDVYSAINAGGVGRYGASDAAAGGAPGSVRDKVENQMADHRRKAEQLLGQGGGTGGAPGGMTTGQTFGSMSPPVGQTFGGMAPSAPQSPVPASIASYATSDEPKTFGDRLGDASKAWEQQMQAHKPPRLSAMGSPGDSGNALLKALNAQTASDMLLQKRLAGIA